MQKFARAFLAIGLLTGFSISSPISVSANERLCNGLEKKVVESIEKLVAKRASKNAKVKAMPFFENDFGNQLSRKELEGKYGMLLAAGSDGNGDGRFSIGEVLIAFEVVRANNWIEVRELGIERKQAVTATNSRGESYSKEFFVIGPGKLEKNAEDFESWRGQFMTKIMTTPLFHGVMQEAMPPIYWKSRLVNDVLDEIAMQPMALKLDEHGFCTQKF